MHKICSRSECFIKNMKKISWTVTFTLDIDCYWYLKFNEYVYWVLANHPLNIEMLRLSTSNLYCMSTLRELIHYVVTLHARTLDLKFFPSEEATYIEFRHSLINYFFIRGLESFFVYKKASLTWPQGFSVTKSFST